MSYPPLVLTKRLVKASKVTPAEEDQNMTDIETAVNGFDAKLAVALNPNGTIKNNAVSTAALQDRSVTLPKLAFLDQFYAVDSGASNAAVISFAPLPLVAYAAGLVFWVKIIADNTGAATLDVDGLGPKNIKVYTTSGIGDPAPGAMKAAGVYVFVYDGTNFVLLNPAPTLTPPVVNTTVGDVSTLFGTDVTFAHGFPSLPMSHWCLICAAVGGDAGFLQNDELDVAGVWVETPGGGDPDYEPLVSTWANVIPGVVGASIHQVEVGAQYFANKGVTEVLLDLTKWKLKNYAKPW